MSPLLNSVYILPLISRIKLSVSLRLKKYDVSNDIMCPLYLLRYSDYFSSPNLSLFTIFSASPCLIEPIYRVFRKLPYPCKILTLSLLSIFSSLLVSLFWCCLVVFSLFLLFSLYFSICVLLDFIYNLVDFPLKFWLWNFILLINFHSPFLMFIGICVVES